MFPFLKDLFNLTHSTQGSFSIASFAQSAYPRTFLGFLVYLWYLTFTYTDLRPWFWAISPAYLAFLPPAVILAIFPGHQDCKTASLNALRFTLILAVLTLLINFLLAPSFPRYLFPTWVCLSLVSAWTLQKIREIWPRIGRWLVPVALLLPLLTVLAIGVKRSIEVFPQYFSKEARISAIEAGFPGYGTFDWANSNLDSNALVISTDPKLYYLDRNAIIATPGIESHVLAPWDSAPSDILANWRELGATHFVLDTTLLSVKHGFGIALFTAILSDRDAVWLDIVTTRAAANEFGIGDILPDEEFLHMSELGELPVIFDGTIDRHLFTQERMELFHGWGRDYRMAGTIMKFIRAGILVEEYRSGPGGGLRIYSIHVPKSDGVALPELPDVTRWCLPYEEGPYEKLPK
jgi:hypothetical protein